MAKASVGFLSVVGLSAVSLGGYAIYQRSNCSSSKASSKDNTSIKIEPAKPAEFIKYKCRARNSSPRRLKIQDFKNLPYSEIDKETGFRWCYKMKKTPTIVI